MDERDECERDAEGEHHLRQDEGHDRIDANRNDDDRGSHGDQATKRNRNATAQKAIHHHLPGQRADAR